MTPRVSARTALICAVAAVACRTTSLLDLHAAPPKEQLSAAEQRAQHSPTAKNEGRAALAAYVITGNRARAEAWADKALANDPGDPSALYTRLLIDRETLNEVGVTRAALAILHRAPKSRFAELAALRLYDVAQDSPATDQMILDGLSGLDSGSMGLEGRAAERAREVLVAIRDGRNDDAGTSRTRATLATPTGWTVIGPLEALRLSDFSKPSPFDDPAHVIAQSYDGSTGAVSPRIIPTPAGALDMATDPWRGDVYEALVDLTVKKGGPYLVALRGATEANLSVDGVEIVQRRSYPNRAPERSWAGVNLPPGHHRLRVRFSRSEGSWIALDLARSDGAPSDVTFHPPAVGSAPPPATARVIKGAGQAPDGDAADGQVAVEMFLRVELEQGSDPDQARADLAPLVAAAGESPVVRALRADLTASDPDLPRGTAISRVTRDIDAILSDDPGDARAQTARFERERSDKRFDDATARLTKLEALLGKKDPRWWMLKAHLAMDRGDEASAFRDADAALKLDPGRCDALDFRLELARRESELSVIDQLTPQAMTCPRGLATNAIYLRDHLKFPEAKALFERILERAPTSESASQDLSDILYAMGDVNDAIAVTEKWDAFWPGSGDGLRRLASIYEAQGDQAKAQDYRKRALALDESNLTLARALMIGSPKDVMSWADRDGLEAIKEYKKANFQSTASSVQVLDLGGLEVEPDGSKLELVHSIVQVLDKKAIDQEGELSLPGNSQPLIVRTVKADGTILDAESIAGKSSISLPNLEPGDFVEYAFLKASGPRPAALPGWQGGQFIFEGEDTPFFESTYRIRVPASVGLKLDTENLPHPAKIVRQGNWLTMTYTARHMPPYLGEPMAPSETELLPWLEAGAGVGQQQMVREAGDWLALRERPTLEVRKFVQGLDKVPLAQRTKAVIDRLRDAVRGDSNSFDFSASAGEIIAQSRGNRMLALKAALEAVGIPSHIVLARAYSSNQHAFLFPHMDIYSTAVLRIEPPGEQPVWMDFRLRLAPYNRLPPSLSEADAYVIPEPGEQAQHITLPKVDPRLDRTDTQLDLALDADGTLTGTVTQKGYGFDAAGARRRLEAVDREQLRRQMERFLDMTFHGVDLTDFRVDDSGDPDLPMTLVSTISVPHFGEHADGSVALPANFGAAQMGERFITQGERKTPLLLASDDFSHLHATLKLPANAKAQALPPVDVQTPFGLFQATWTLNGRALSYDEELSLHRGRIPPARYGEFRSFAAAVDAAQQREIPLGTLGAVTSER